MREDHLQQNLSKSGFTTNLYKQYKKHLGFVRYLILIQVQLLLTPDRVKKLLFPAKSAWLNPTLHIYKALRFLKLEGAFKNALLPMAYKSQIKKMDSI